MGFYKRCIIVIYYLRILKFTKPEHIAPKRIIKSCENNCIYPSMEFR